MAATITTEQSIAIKLKVQGYTLKEIERILGIPKNGQPGSRKGAGARHLLKTAYGKKRVGGLYE
jgi:hypothetical protein